MAYPDTFYARSLTEAAIRPALQGVADTDTVIIGGGLAGLTTALELARAGIQVTVLESESVGFGASGRNGGIVSPAFACGSAAITARVGGPRKVPTKFSDRCRRAAATNPPFKPCRRRRSWLSRMIRSAAGASGCNAKKTLCSGETAHSRFGERTPDASPVYRMATVGRSPGGRRRRLQA